MFATGLGYGAEAPPESVVRIEGCSGVCVSPSGVFLTVKHCGHKERATVEFSDGRRIEARKVYASKETDGPVVLVADSGAPFPASPVAMAPPQIGARVYSWGFPAGGRTGARNLTYADGVVSGGRDFKAIEVGLNPLLPPYRANTVDGMAIDGGWSGGPLFNERGEVCGLASASDNRESVWIPFTATREAYMIAAAHVTARTVEYYSQPNCPPCAHFAADQDRRAFPNYVFVPITEPPEGVEGAPAFAYLGKTKKGYDGPGDLLTWLYRCELTAAPQREKPPAYAEVEPVPEPAPGSSSLAGNVREQIAEVRALVERCANDVKEFQEAGAIGKLRQIDDLKADAADAKAMAAAAVERTDAIRADYSKATEEHPWYYGLGAVALGIFKRRFLNPTPRRSVV